jgi:hypothetical protein
MRRFLKSMMIVMAVFMCLFVGLWEWSSHADHQRFHAAKNDCERGCIQDSGGLDQCRAICVHHPDRYP